MQAQGTPLKVFRNRAFAQYWLGSLVSRLGDHLGDLALAWLTLQRTGSPAAVGLVMATYPAAGLLTNLVAGHLHDRWPRRRLLLADNLARGALFAAFPLLDHAGTLALPTIMGLVVAAGALAAISRVGEKVVLPNLVADADLEPANAVSQAIWQLAYLLGPALGGIATATLGAAPTLGLNGLSFWVFALLLVRIPAARFHAAPLPQGAGGEPTSTDASHRPGTAALDRDAHATRAGAAGDGDRHEAWSFLRRHRVLALLALTGILFNFTYAPLEPALPVFVARELARGPEVLGWLWAAFAGGTIAVSLAWTRLAGGRRWQPLTTTAGIMLAWGLCNLALATATTAPAALVLMAVGGLVYGPYGVVANTYQQRAVPDRLRGRVFAIVATCGDAAFPAGALVGGWLTADLGARGAILTAGAACAAVAVGLLIAGRTATTSG